MTTHRTHTPARFGTLVAVVGVWAGERPRRAAAALLWLAFGALLASATATREVGFTLQISYAATALAVVVGAPFALRGWLRLPGRLRIGAGALLAVYALAALVGDGGGLTEQASRSSHRDLVYLADLVLGLATIGLVVGVADTPRRLRRLVMLFAGGVGLAAAYGVYQWFALHFGWPLSDTNTAPNSDGFSIGHRFQGSGILGWERIRGTFKEPLFFATFLATGLPVVAALTCAARGRARLALAGILAVVAVTLGLTVSSLTWGVLLVCCAVILCALAVAHGQIRLAAVMGAGLTAIVLVAPVMFADPSALSAVTGRSSTDLRATTHNRTDAWSRAVATFESRPILGHGPGQSAVRLAYRPDGTALGPGVTAPRVFGSAQGLWAASLIDGGLLALAGWVLLFGALALWVGRTLLLRPNPLLAGLATSGLVAWLAAQLAGDRLDIRVWLVCGLVAAAACQAREPQAAERGEQA